MLHVDESGTQPDDSDTLNRYVSLTYFESRSKQSFSNHVTLALNPDWTAWPTHCVLA